MTTYYCNRIVPYVDSFELPLHALTLSLTHIPPSISDIDKT